MEEAAEFGRENLEDKTIIGTVLSQPFSAIEGFLDYFVENDSELYIYNKEATEL